MTRPPIQPEPPAEDRPPKPQAKLYRQHFRTSRAMDFFSEKELISQTGHQVQEWPLVCLKELVDNALDACEEAAVAPVIAVTVNERGITVEDNGPGIPISVIDAVQDFSTRVSSREAYVSPSRGAQGNALKTVIAMPFALAGGGTVTIEARGQRHDISASVDQIKQEPVISRKVTASRQVQGTKFTVEWPDTPRLIEPNQNVPFLQNGEKSADKPRLILASSKAHFLQMAENYAWLNPHLTLSLKWSVDRASPYESLIEASHPEWSKWSPSEPTDAHWYGADDFERLIAANICHNPDRLVREFVSEFRGLSGSAKQKRVLDAACLKRSRLSDLVIDGAIDKAVAARLLKAMKDATTPVKPLALGVIGENHLRTHCEAAGGDLDTFRYRRVAGVINALPCVIETCFAYCPAESNPRRIIAGLNWSPSIINPFRQLGPTGCSLDSLLECQRVGRLEPTIFVLHIASPGIRYADRGKSSVIIAD